MDSFHTGYVLRCLLDLRDLVPGAERAVAAGARFYAERYFDDRGRAMLWPGRDYPEDGHSAGTALTTLAALNRAGFGYEELLDRVVRRVLAAMLRDGRVVHRRYRLGRTTVRYVRWCDAHVALGLTDAALALSPASAEATSTTIA